MISNEIDVTHGVAKRTGLTFTEAVFQSTTRSYSKDCFSEDLKKRSEIPPFFVEKLQWAVEENQFKLGKCYAISWEFPCHNFDMVQNTIRIPNISWRVYWPNRYDNIKRRFEHILPNIYCINGVNIKFVTLFSNAK